MPRNKIFSIRKKHLRKCRLFKRPGKEALPGSGSHTEYRNVLDHCPPEIVICEFIFYCSINTQPRVQKKKWSKLDLVIIGLRQ